MTADTIHSLPNGEHTYAIQPPLVEPGDYHLGDPGDRQHIYGMLESLLFVSNAWNLTQDIVEADANNVSVPPNPYPRTVLHATEGDFIPFLLPTVEIFTGQNGITDYARQRSTVGEIQVDVEDMEIIRAAEYIQRIILKEVGVFCRDEDGRFALTLDAMRKVSSQTAELLRKFASYDEYNQYLQAQQPNN